MKETNAERIKREKDGLGVWTDILRYAGDGSAPIDPDDLDRLLAVTNDEGEVGFDLWVGGGLGARPRLAERLGAFIWYDEVPEVVTRIVELFRDHGGSSDRRKARMKFLLARWGVSRFRAELETRLGRNLDDSVLSQPPRVPRRKHLGIGAQRRAGFHYIGVAVLAGRISGAQMTSVAGLARRYASGRVRLTNAQNLIVLDVPRQHVGILDSALGAVGLDSHASPFRRGTVASKLVVVETKDRAKEIVKHLEAALPDFRNELVKEVFV